MSRASWNRRGLVAKDGDRRLPHRAIARWAGPLCAALHAPGCSPSSNDSVSSAGATYEVMIEARRGNGRGMVGAEIQRDAHTLGVTDDAGDLRLTLSGREGDTVALTVRCPAGFVSPAQPILVGLRRLAPGSLPPHFDADCKPSINSLVVGLRADHGAGLPVLYLGKVIARTDAWGVAHFVIDSKPSEQVALTLDTRSNRSLRPESPTISFLAPDRDELVLLEQKFTLKRTIVRAPKPVVPRRL